MMKINETGAQVTSFQESIEEMKSELAARQSHIEKLNARCEELTHETEHREQSLTSALEQNVLLKAQFDELTQRVLESEHLSHMLEESAAKLRTCYQSVNSQYSELESLDGQEFMQIPGEVTLSTVEYVSLYGEGLAKIAQVMVEKYIHHSRILESRESCILECQGRLETQAQQLAELESNIVQTSGQNPSIEGQEIFLSERCNDLQSECEELQRKSAEVEQVNIKKDALILKLKSKLKEKIAEVKEIKLTAVDINSKLHGADKSLPEGNDIELITSVLNSLNVRNQELLCQCKESEQLVANQMAKVESTDQQVADLADQLDKYRTDVELMETSIQEKNISLRVLTEESTTYEKEVHLLKEELEDVKQKQMLLVSEREAFENDHMDEITALQIELETVSTHNKAMEVNVKEVSDECSRVANERDDIECEMVDIKHMMESIKSELASTIAEKYNVETAFAQAEHRLAKTQEENQRMRSESVELCQRLDALTLEKSSLLAQLEEASRKAEALIQQEVTLPLSVEPPQIETELRQKSSSSDTNLHSQYEDLLTDFQKVTNKLEVTEIKNDKMLVKLRTFKEKNDKLQGQLMELESECSTSNATFNKMKHQLGQEKIKLLTEHEEVKKRLSIAEGEVQKLVLELETSRQKYGQLEGEHQTTTEDLKLQVTSLMHQYEMIQRDNAQAKGQTQRLQVELRTVSADRDEKVQALKYKEELHQNLTSTLDKLSIDYKALEAEFSNAKEAFVQQKADFKMQFDMLLSDVEHHQSLVANMRQANLFLEQEAAKARQAVTSAENQLAESQEGKEQLESKNAVLLDKLEELTSSINGRHDHTTEMTNLQAENVRMQELLTTMENERRELKSEVDRFEWRVQELEEADDEHEETRNKLFDVMSTNTALKNRIKGLETQVDVISVMKADNDSTSEAYGKALTDNSALIKQVEELYSQVHAAKNIHAQMDLLKKENSGLNSQLLGKAGEMETLQSSLQEVEKQKGNLYNELCKLREENSRLAVELNKRVHEVQGQWNEEGATVKSERVARIASQPVDQRPASLVVPPTSGPSSLSRASSPDPDLAMTTRYRAFEYSPVHLNIRSEDSDHGSHTERHTPDHSLDTTDHSVSPAPDQPVRAYDSWRSSQVSVDVDDMTDDQPLLPNTFQAHALHTMQATYSRLQRYLTRSRLSLSHGNGARVNMRMVILLYQVLLHLYLIFGCLLPLF